MYEKIRKAFAEYLNNEDYLSKITEAEMMQRYGDSEIHCIETIGKTEDPNVTKIAEKLDMTRGAISKLTKRLMAAGLIMDYQSETNRKEIYFTLTEAGQAVFNEHEKRHALWLKREDAFFNRYSEDDLENIYIFLMEYNKYLEEQADILSPED